jgi:hypothetical protein
MWPHQQRWEVATTTDDRRFTRYGILIDCGTVAVPVPHGFTAATDRL